MKIIKTTSYYVSYVVQYAEATEGGMDYEIYQDGIDTLVEAIEVLELAEKANSNRPWEIVCNVSKQVKEQSR